ncbi:hypothetical protein [Kitasatospora sp. NPDC059571]|uniref:hypothetical protein n=1 Tax=Kitasatospora sp. NPDC059571 TaxID=3346871 RepID=UPI0036AE9BE4
MTTGTPAAARRPAPVALIAVLVVFGLLAAAVDALFSLGMVFGTDSCGTGAAASAGALCNTAVWGLLVLLPWAGLAAGLVAAGIAAAVARRRGRSPWIALLPGVGLPLAALAISCLAVFA